ncbi:ABC transporter ATP-binding protein [Paraburkholderia caribensis]|uniref:ABC transporter ATP-binding protein n=1 Tax=Paraburkholderia caribensis TaxID=75105 RepID=UPI001CAD43A0|nr:ABC transporter ATP-binding protein [Paraburkholderia caribensis]CAG9269658.1 ABC transporter ATP-binding protein [Paraburkholderia caribensis]
MSRVNIESLRKNFDSKPPSLAIDSLDLEIQEGEFLALLGPSGCGKTTTLRSVAGLETPDFGRITIGNKTVFDAAARVNVSPDRRNIGMVFQSYALWPHMTVEQNIAYPLATRKQRADVIKARVKEVAELVECDHLLSRLPAQLSGGQQQRVALARALVASPQLILFDEPLSNLDARLRDQMRIGIHRIHRARPFTAIYVTHDQSEALALGQRIAIMRQGKLEQLGTPEAIYETPISEYVAGFVGMSNRLPVRAVCDGWDAGGVRLFGPAIGNVRWPALAALRFGMADCHLVANAEQVKEDEVGLPARVLDTEFGGRYRFFTVEAGNAQIRISMLARESWIQAVTANDHLVLAFPPARVAAFADPVEAGRVNIVRPAESASMSLANMGFDHPVAATNRS